MRIEKSWKPFWKITIINVLLTGVSYSSFLSYLQALSPRIPSEHWWAIGLVSLTVAAIYLIRKGVSKYGAIAIGLTVMFGLFLLDALALKRLGGDAIRPAGFDLGSEYHRIIHGSVEERLLLLFNFLVFVPLGILLTETVLTVKHCHFGRCFQLVLVAALGLSFCIELLQLIFHVGVFELTDIFLNTLGAGAGASATLGVRSLLEKGLDVSQKIK